MASLVQVKVREVIIPSELETEPAAEQSSPIAPPQPVEEIIRRYASLVLRTCYAVTRNIHDAEDAAQATFIALAQQLQTGEPIRQIGGWLTQVAHRTALDVYRSRQRRKRRENFAGRRELFADENFTRMDAGELAEIVRVELQKLPADYRTPLILHYYGGLTSSQIARQLGCQSKALAMRLLRGRRMLAQRLGRRGIAIGSSALTAAIVMSIQRDVAANLVPSGIMPTATLGAASPIHASFPDGTFSVALSRVIAAIARHPRRAIVAGALLSATAISGGSQYFQAQQLLATPDWLRSITSNVARLIRSIPTPKLRLSDATPAENKDPTPVAPPVVIAPPPRQFAVVQPQSTEPLPKQQNLTPISPVTIGSTVNSPVVARSAPTPPVERVSTASSWQIEPRIYSSARHMTTSETPTPPPTVVTVVDPPKKPDVDATEQTPPKKQDSYASVTTHDDVGSPGTELEFAL